MKIAAHISGDNNTDSLLLASLKLISVKYQQHSFTFFVEKRINDLANNCKQVVVSPKHKNKFLLYFWYTFKLSAILKKEQSDVFINDAGMQCANCRIPQFLFFHKVDFKEKSNRFYKGLFAAALVNAKAIFATEDFIKENLVNEFNVDTNKIKTIYYGLDESHLPPANNALLAETKERFTNGVDYFLYPVSIATTVHIMAVLKAFSQLKKWQKTSMKLVLLLEGISQNHLKVDFKNYKYREDIIFVKDTNEHKVPLMQSAFALIYFSEYRTDCTAFQAFQHNVPVIAADSSINKSLFGAGAIFTSIGEKALSEKMQLIYKDDLLKSQLTKEGSKIVEKYNATVAAEDLYKAILE